MTRRNVFRSSSAIADEIADRVEFEKVRKSESLLAEAEQLANLGSWEHDLETGEETWSANLCRILGTGTETRKFSRGVFWDLVHPDDRQMVSMLIECGMKDRQSYEYQARFVLPDGRERILLTRGKPVVDSGNRIIKRVGFTQDVTITVEGQRALLESEERYRDLVENSHDLICTHDMSGVLLSMNELPARLLGYRREEMIGRSIPEFLAADVRETFGEYFQRIERDGSAKGLMILMTRSGERRIWEYANTLRTAGVPIPIVRGMAHDVTEQFNARQALHNSQARLKALVESIDDVVIELDLEGTVLDIWTTRPELLFRPREEQIGRRVSDIMGPDFFHPFAEIFKRVLASGKSEELEYPLSLEVGERWFVARVTPIPATDRTYKSLCLLVRDITERKAAEETLRRQEASLQSLLSISNKLNASLDVNTILRCIVREAAIIADAKGGGSVTIGPSGPVGNCFFDEGTQKESTITWDLRDGAMAWILEHKLPYLSNDAANDPRISPLVREAFHLQQLLAIPITDLTGKVIAIIGVHNKRNDQGFTLADTEHLMGLAGMSGIALENAIAYRKIRRGEAQLQTLSRRLLTLQDMERRRISLHLHESIAQDLVGLRLCLGQLRRCVSDLPESLRHSVDEAMKISHVMVKDVRTLSYSLHPPRFEQTGLATAVPWYAAEFAERSGIRVEVEISDRVGRLGPNQETALFRIMQESLTNIHRHSGSDWANIRIAREGCTITMEIEDRGKGMSADSRARLSGGAPSGVGIAGMRERVKELNGTFDIESVPGKGVTVRVTLRALTNGVASLKSRRNDGYN